MPEQLHTFLTETLFPSPVFLNYGKPILQQKFSLAGFKIALGLKDINLFLDAAKSLDLSSPFAQELHKRLLISVDKGGNRDGLVGYFPSC